MDPVHKFLKLSLCLFALVAGPAIGFARAESLTILNTQTGTTPAYLGYNLGHFMPTSNTADWATSIISGRLTGSAETEVKAIAARPAKRATPLVT
jgi:hypothetical protein